MNRRTVSIIQLLIAGTLWSLSGLFIKLIDLSPLAIASARSLIAAFVVLSFLKFKPKFTFSKAQIMGALCYVVTVMLFVSANKMTTAANAILLQYGAPIYVAFLGYFILHEKLKWFDFIGIFGIAVGMFVFFGGSLSGGSIFGNILAILSGVTFAGQAVCMRLQKDEPRVETALLGNILTFLVGAPFLFVAPPAVSEFTPLLILGVFQLGIPYILYPLAAKHVTALDLIFIPMIEPLLNPVWVFVGTGEKPSVYALFGGAIVLSMVAFKSVCALKLETGAGANESG